MTTKIATTLLPYGPHFSGAAQVPGIQNVRDDLIGRVTGQIRNALATSSIVLVTAPSGAGKSFTAARSCERVLDRTKLGFQLNWLDYSNWARGWTLLRELHDQLIGDGLADRLTPRALRHDLRNALSEERRLLVLDEAQWVSPESLLVLCKLNDHVDTDFALVILATPAIYKKLPDEVQSRVLHHDRIDLLPDRDVVRILCGYHDAFAAANPKRLELLNRTKAYGQFRYWAEFISCWWTLGGKKGRPLDEAMIDLVVDAVADKGRWRR